MRTLTRRYARTHARLRARVPPRRVLSPFSRERSLGSARTVDRRLLSRAVRSCPQGKSTQKDKFNADDAELPAQGEKVRPGLPFE